MPVSLRLMIGSRDLVKLCNMRLISRCLRECLCGVGSSAKPKDVVKR